MKFSLRRNGQKMVTIRESYHFTTQDIAITLVEKLYGFSEINFEILKENFPSKKDVEETLRNYVVLKGSPRQHMQDFVTDGEEVVTAEHYVKEIMGLI